MSSDKKNSFWLALQYIIGLVLSLIALKLNLTHFGENVFGMWLIFISFWGIGNALDLGFGTTIIKFVAEEKEKKEYLKISQIVSVGFLFFIITGILLLILGGIASFIFFLGNEKIVSSKLLSTAQNILLILGFNFYFQYISLFFRSILEGMSNFVALSKIVILYNILNLALVIGVTILDLSIIKLAIGMVTISVLTSLVYYIYIKKIYNNIQINIKLINRGTIKNLLKFSVSIQFSTIFSSLIEPSIKYIIGTYTTLSFVSLYEVGRRFATAVSGLFSNSFKTILPKTSLLKNPIEYREFLYKDGLNLSRFGILYSGFTFGIGSFLFGIIIYFFFRSDGILITFLILCLPESINNFGYLMYIFIIGIGKPHFVSIIQGINLIIISASLIICFQLFDSILGLLGYFLTVVFVNILMLFYVKYVSDISIKKFLTQAKIFKLLFLILLILVGTFCLYFNILNQLVVTSFISILSFLIFRNDSIFYYKKFLNFFRTKYV